MQIGDENVHRVRALMDEILGAENFVSQVNFKSMGALGQADIPNVYDYILWYARSRGSLKFRPLFRQQTFADDPEYRFVSDPSTQLGYRVLRPTDDRNPDHSELFRRSTLTSSGYTPSCTFTFEYQGERFDPFGGKSWRTNHDGMNRLATAGRAFKLGKNLYFRRFATDSQLIRYENSWIDPPAAAERIYVVQTAPKFVERCVLMTTDPGDLVLDPTCGSGTTTYVAEQWGRRWITIDTSRVALALARARIMGTRYPYYLLSDSAEGRKKEAEITHTEPSEAPSYSDIRQGFVYERVPHIQLRDIANNAEIDVIWEQFQTKLEPLRNELNAALDESWEEREIPREAEGGWSAEARALHEQWWEQRIARQRDIDASIAAKADSEYLYDKPYTDNRRVRVAGPFTVESLSPHRVLGVDEDDELIDGVAETLGTYGEPQDFGSMILAHLSTAGVQQAHKEDRIEFSSVAPWPGEMICAEGRYAEGGAGSNGTGPENRAGIFIGPEFGTVSRPDLVEAAREAADAGFDVLIACAFNYEAHATEFNRLGRVPVLKARMNADLHMAGDLKNTGKGNLFVIFGEPDIDILDASDDDDAEPGQVKVKVNGVDVFHPNTGEVRSDGPDGIACWFIDTDYNEESFFVRHAYFLGQNDPYKAIKTTLKAEINEEAWETLHSDTSRPFDKPESGRIAVKVINHLGDEVMKVFRVD